MTERIPEGYVLLARKIRKSPLWLSLKATHRVVMIELLLKAQFQDGNVVRNGEVLLLNRGQIATSYQELVDDIGDKDVTVKVVRNAINKLVKHDFLAKDEAKARAKKGLLLTIVNYGVYQDAENYKGKEKGKETGNEGAKQGQSEGKAGAINNNVKNFNNAEQCSNNDYPTAAEAEPGTEENSEPKVERYDMFYTCFGYQPSAIQIEDMNKFIDESGFEDKQICLAFKKAGRDHKAYSYARKILVSWAQKGINTYEDALKEQQEFENQKSYRQQSRKPRHQEPMPKSMSSKPEQMDPEEEERLRKQLEEKLRA